MNAAPRTLFLLAATIGAALLYANSELGPDLDHYTDWTNAFRHADIFELRGEVLSPHRVPFSFWSFGPGLVFSQVPAASDVQSDKARLLLFGAMWAVLFWAAMYVVLWRAARGDRLLTLFGLAVAFCATPLGVYSLAIASETLTLPCVAIPLARALHPRPWRVPDLVLLGLFSALLLVLRPQLILCLVPIAAVAGHSWCTASESVRKKTIWLFASAFPVVLAAIAVAIVNRWMTGHFARFPYHFSGEGFHSVDFGHAHFKAVLFHPWHGLLPYHPVFAIFVVVTVVMISTKQPGWKRALLALVLASFAALVALHAGWCVWWLGRSIGQRGFVASAVVFMPILLSFLSEHKGSFIAKIIVVLVLLCGVWSFLVGLDAGEHRTTYHALWMAQKNWANRLVHDPIFVWCFSACAVSMTAGLLVRRRENSILLIFAAGLGWTAIFFSLASPLLHHWQAAHRYGVLPAAACALAVALLPLGLSRLGQADDPDDQVWPGRIGTWALLFALGILLILSVKKFVQLTSRVETAYQQTTPLPRAFKYQGAFLASELEASYREYQRCPGFEEEKRSLRRFLDHAEREGSARPIH